MRLGYVMTEGRGETDRLLADLAEALMAEGMRLAGVVQTNTECAPSHLCDMDVRVLPAGPKICISQSLGAGARGCRLNPDALEQAVAHVGAALHGGAAQILILNKFGKHEAGGRGFRPLIAEALALDLPVLAGVNRGNLDAFQTFAQGLATPVQPSLTALLDWARGAVAADPA